MQAKSEIYQKCLQGPNEEFQGVVQDLHGTQQDILDRDHVRFHPVVDVDHLGAVVAEEVVTVEVIWRIFKISSYVSMNLNGNYKSWR